jgi:hypothetical protein
MEGARVGLCGKKIVFGLEPIGKSFSFSQLPLPSSF